MFKELLEKVHVPAAVLAELRDKGAPEAVREWARVPPAWLVCDPEPQGERRDELDDPLLTRLHRGEREAILLAQRIKADLLLVDERAARRAARQKGLEVAGLLSALRLAAERGLLDFPSAVQELREAGFRMSPDLIRRLR